ncbi:3-oxo-5-alpha-steroid 4-dehydrogenase [Xylariomycetidae sp. FL2044]|nr:3-oxo-5-alpha-steroid 4-dehydrogenase [Xylariomycetidae sp. FL2044]
MASLIQDWFPPSRENYDFILTLWTFYPLLVSVQWIVPHFYPMGKTSITSRFNIPGRIAWFTMEVPGFITLLYTIRTLSAQHGIEDLPWQNKVLAGLYVIHYVYRAVLFPFIQPSMSPIHAVVWASAVFFNLCNATCIGSWLGAYGPTTQEEWHARNWSILQFSVGLVVFYIGLTANYFSDEELREIRRAELRRQERLEKQGKSVDKHYEVPNGGLFKYMLYPHYFMEWVEWLGFWIAAGVSCAPARNFLLNEVSAMLPRAVNGSQWYRERFGQDKIKGKYVIIPGVY